MHLKYTLLRRIYRKSSAFILVFFGIMFFFSGCDNKQENFSRLDNLEGVTLIENNYSELVQKNPEELNNIELYNRALTLWKVPFAELDVNTDFGKAHILVTGSQNKPALVLLHGMNATSTMWYPNISELAKHFRIYAIDHISADGKSAANNIDDLESIDQHIEWYKQIFNILNLDEIYLVGASQGGWLAINLVLNDAKRFKKLALLSPAQSLTWVNLNEALFQQLVFTIISTRSRFDDVLDSMSEQADKIHPLYTDLLYAKFEADSIPAMVTEMRPFSDEQLSMLKLPVLFLYGDNDSINDEQSADRAKSTIAEVTVLKVPNSGHFINTDNSEFVNREVINFIKK